MDEESLTREAIKSKGVKPLADMHPVTAIARGGMLKVRKLMSIELDGHMIADCNTPPS